MLRPLRLPARLVSVALRLTVKPALAIERSPQAMRARLEASAGRLFRLPRGVAEAADPLGGVPALRLTPEALEPDTALLYLHGGAYLAGSPRTHRHLAARLAKEAGTAAWAVDYRLAPEHPFPAAIEDATAAYAALIDRGVAPGRIAVAGDSAGGGLAAALLLSAAEAGLEPPGCLVAFSPWADMTGRAASLARNRRRDAMLPARRLADVAGHVLQGADPAHPFASPALGRFDTPPPAYLAASRAEIIADDARALAAALSAGGGAVRLAWAERLPHAWPVFAGWLAEADATIAEAGRFIARSLAR